MTSIILFCSEMGIPRGSDAFKLTYSPTHARAAPYFVGMVVGILLHDERVAKFRIPKVRQITIQNIVRGGGEGVTGRSVRTPVLFNDDLFSTRQVTIYLCVFSQAAAWLVLLGSWLSGFAILMSAYVFYAPERPFDRLESATYCALQKVALALSSVAGIVCTNFADFSESTT